LTGVLIDASGYKVIVRGTIRRWFSLLFLGSFLPEDAGFVIGFGSIHGLIGGDYKLIQRFSVGPKYCRTYTYSYAGAALRTDFN